MSEFHCHKLCEKGDFFIDLHPVSKQRQFKTGKVLGGDFQL